jgi:hypothetical protein
MPEAMARVDAEIRFRLNAVRDDQRIKKATLFWSVAFCFPALIPATPSSL